MSTYALFDVERITKSLPPRTVLYSAGAGLCVGILVTAVVVHLFSANPTLSPCPLSLTTETTTGIPQKQKVKVFTVVTDIQRNWFAALTDCRRRGLELASLEFDEEYVELYNQITPYREKGVQDLNFWLSGTSLGDGSTYVWMSSGCNVTDTFHNGWHLTEPSHDEDCTNAERGHCVEITEDFGMGLNDYCCDRKQFYVCQSRIQDQCQRP